MFQEKTISNFIKNLASAEPVPGGGSVSALAGALAVGLALMAINITLIKICDRKTKTKLLKTRKKIEPQAKEFLRLMNEDIAAFSRVIKAFKLPKITEIQRRKRSKMIQAGYRAAAFIPLRTAVLALELKLIIKGFKNSLLKIVASDIKVAEFLTEAALKGAIANVRINLPGIKDKKFKAKANLALKKITRAKIINNK